MKGCNRLILAAVVLLLILFLCGACSARGTLPSPVSGTSSSMIPQARPSATDGCGPTGAESRTMTVSPTTTVLAGAKGGTKTVSPTATVLAGATSGTITIAPTATALAGAGSGTVTALPTRAVLVGAGDIAGCGSEKDEETARLLDHIAGTVFTVGDNVYPDGTDEQFTRCYDPTWGRHKARTRPSPGNHDYHVPGASAYFKYFGVAAGDVDKGYYSYELGDWHIIALNSECAQVGGCRIDSPQGQWLRADLAAHPSWCTLAYWHQPLFSSGSVHGGDEHMRDFWRLLYDAGADVVVNGHEHVYERFAPQNPRGRADPEHGIRQFTVGTGGGGLYGFDRAQPNSEVRSWRTHGVLKLTLYPTSYDWEFISIAGQAFTDSGSADCVSPP